MTDTQLSKQYSPAEIENKWYEIWESANYFEPNQNETPFCMMIPPPNVTGSLHMGHAFEATIMDTLIRFRRMQGCSTLWQVGTDHAGIATQMVVERQLAQTSQTRHDIGRDKFIEKIWQWKETSGSRITNQLRRMGASADWNRERFTMDEGLSEAVKTVFIKLYDEGLIYRGHRLVNWDPVLHTAISDLEVVSEEENGFLWHIHYPLQDGSGYVEVATTRPETLFGDVAVAVHPEDTRFKALVGQHVKLPLCDRSIPIIADDYVDPEFGTGCLKITPAHDFNDYEVGARHGFTPINVFTDNATLNEQVPTEFQGLDRFVARKLVIEKLKAAKLLFTIKPHRHKIPRGDRSGSIIEPYLTKQWYVKIQPLAEPAIAAVKNGDITFTPSGWENTYFAWMENIQDWCISRQLWWGHRIPAWYDDSGHIYVGKDEQTVRQKYQLPLDLKLSQDDDVLDTWFSSALWPFSTLGWPQKTDDLKRYYPTNVLVTGFDIIFFWVARMIMFGLKFTGQVPFKTIMIHGLIRDNDGKKMSKSKGNVLDPLDLIDGIDLDTLIKKRTQDLMQPEMAASIEKKTREAFPDGIESYGTDALRFTFCSLASTGRNIVFDFGRLDGYRNFCNKIWNAARFVLMNTNHQDNDYGDEAFQFSVADRWIKSQLQTTIATVTEALDNFRFDLAAQAAYDFMWHQYCDWYLEFSKSVLYAKDASAAQLRGTRQTLIDVLESFLRLIHPMMPYVTEEIWQIIAPLGSEQKIKTIMLAPYPKEEAKFVDRQADEEIAWLKEMTVSIRTIRAEMNIAPGKPIPLLLKNSSPKDDYLINKFAVFIKSMAKVNDITLLAPDAKAPTSATALVGNLDVLIPMADLIDIAQENKRLVKEQSKLEKELSKCQTKLNNPNYIEKAPEAVVEMERERMREYSGALEKVKQQLEQLKTLS